jgi:hypothetical protein
MTTRLSRNRRLVIPPAGPPFVELSDAPEPEFATSILDSEQYTVSSSWPGLRHVPRSKRLMGSAKMVCLLFHIRLLCSTSCIRAFYVGVLCRLRPRLSSIHNLGRRVGYAFEMHNRGACCPRTSWLPAHSLRDEIVVSSTLAMA